MIFPNPRTWVNNLFVTDAVMNEIRDALRFLLDPPGCQLTRSTAQSIPVNVATAISFNVEDFDNDTMHDPSTNPSRATCVTPGRYLVSGIIPYDAGTTGVRESRIAKNGITVNGGRTQIAAPGGGAVTMVAAAVEVSMVQGDYIELMALHTNAAALTTTAVNALFPLLRARLVGP